MYEQKLFKLEPKFDVTLNTKVHMQYLPYYLQIRTYQDWVGLGFSLKLDKYGIAKQTAQKLPYEWCGLSDPDPVEVVAAKTLKRHVASPFCLLDYVRLGISYDEFVPHPEHYRYYCDGLLAAEAGAVERSIALLHKAVEADPGNAHYADKYYCFRVDAGDVSAVDEELVYSSGKASSIIHAGRYDEWIKLLLKQKLYGKAAEVTIQVSELLDKAASGLPVNGLHPAADVPFTIYKREQFRAQICKWQNAKRYSLMFKALNELGVPDWLAVGVK